MVHIPDSPIKWKTCEWCGELFSYVDNSNPRKFCKKGKCAVAYHRAKRAQRRRDVRRSSGGNQLGTAYF